MSKLATCLTSTRCGIYLEWLMALLIAAAVTSAWRGAWLLLDALLLPEHPLGSCMASIGMGSIGLALLAAVQPELASWARAHQQQRALWAADALYSYLGGWVCVLYWRGVWLLWDYAFQRGLPSRPIDAELAADGCASHAVGLSMLLLLGAMRNFVASPMVITSDASVPIFGAGMTAGLGSINPVARLKRPPAVQSAREWYVAVGVPDLTSLDSATVVRSTSAAHTHGLR